MPEIEVHARGKDREDDDLEIFEHNAVRIMEKQRCNDICCRENYTASIVEYVMLQQNDVQAIVGRTPALYGVYESEGDEPQFECHQKNKRYEVFGATRSLVAACDTRDWAGLIWCGGSGSKEDSGGCYDDSKKRRSPWLRA